MSRLMDWVSLVGVALVGVVAVVRLGRMKRGADMSRLMDWVSLVGAALMGVAAVVAAIMTRLEGGSIGFSLLGFLSAAVCFGYMSYLWRTRQPPPVSKDDQLAAEAATYSLAAMSELAGALTDDDPRVTIQVGSEPTGYRGGPSMAMIGMYSHWQALWNSLAEHGYLFDWDWDEPPAGVFDWACEAVSRRWPGIDLRELVATHGHLGAWTSSDYNPSRDDNTVESPQALDGYLAPHGIRVGWFDNGSAYTLFLVSQHGFDRITALHHTYNLARPVNIAGLDQNMLKRRR